MLTITPTPLGNLKDLTFRAKESLEKAEIIIAENPSHTQKILNHYQIPKKPVHQFAEHNETKALPKLIELLKTQDACLVTDAGTPGISDPGFRLVRACLENNIQIDSLPGANAATTALAASGLPTDKYIFLGFLGKTEHKVIEPLKQAEQIEATAIFYESPERIQKTMGVIAKHFPLSKSVIAREITKLHQEYIRGTSTEVADILNSRQNIKGEITVLISFKN